MELSVESGWTVKSEQRLSLLVLAPTPCPVLRLDSRGSKSLTCTRVSSHCHSPMEQVCHSTAKGWEQCTGVHCTRYQVPLYSRKRITGKNTGTYTKYSSTEYRRIFQTCTVQYEYSLHCVQPIRHSRKYYCSSTV
jgi:hypothetical protein